MRLGLLLDGHLQLAHLGVVRCVVDLASVGRGRREHGGIGAEVGRREVALLTQ